jgi:hypothetical protein
MTIFQNLLYRQHGRLEISESVDDPRTDRHRARAMASLELAVCKEGQWKLLIIESSDRAHILGCRNFAALLPAGPRQSETRVVKRSCVFQNHITKWS